MANSTENHHGQCTGPYLYQCHHHHRHLQKGWWKDPYRLKCPEYTQDPRRAPELEQKNPNRLVGLVELACTSARTKECSAFDQESQGQLG
nr:hypothetical protein CFP56_08505 [Quercus suber]